MAITRWARRAVLTATALAFALPFSTGTAQADPIIEALADNNVNVTVGAYNNNVDSIPVSLGAGASLNTGSGITLGSNEGIQLAMEIGHATVWADAAVKVPFTNAGVEASAAAAVDAPAVAVDTAAPPAEPAIAEPAIAEPAIAEPAAAEPAVAQPAVAEPAVAEPVLAAPPAPEAAPVLESAVTITDETAAVTDDPKGDEEEDCPEEVEPSGCPNITALGILSVCLLPNLVQLHI